MKMTIKYELKGLQFKLMNGIIQDIADILFHANSEETLKHFLDVLGVELSGVQDAEVLGETLYISVDFDFEFTYKPFTSVDEVPQGLEQVVTYVDENTLYGYMEVQGKNIIVHHYAWDLGEDKLEELSTKLIHEDLTDKVFFHIPKPNRVQYNIPIITE
ncbi:hypothetical protein [Bacillus toyonensis]|uniref:hypothetical protein n=1 Tax=Bacillus toyonensis TaxID=155322 RepID=UPI000BF7E26E|nr:hypothetical protein [Bacillus toyonensis]PGF05395.1 hypothetical protein COM61_02740 [Bacillus toyonensis]